MTVYQSSPSPSSLSPLASSLTRSIFHSELEHLALWQILSISDLFLIDVKTFRSKQKYRYKRKKRENNKKNRLQTLNKRWCQKKKETEFCTGTCKSIRLSSGGLK